MIVELLIVDFCKFNRFKSLKFLFKFVDINTYSYNIIAIKIAVKYTNINIVKYVIKNSEFDTSFKELLLCNAFYYESYDIANYLIKNGTDVNSVNNYYIKNEIFNNDKILKILINNGYNTEKINDEKCLNKINIIKNQIRIDKINKLK